jgi:hypothetical protein
MIVTGAENDTKGILLILWTDIRGSAVLNIDYSEIA